jgi:hypothetical protein
MVSDIIGTKSCLRKTYVIRQKFIAPNLNAILNIPLSQGGGEDV